MNRNNSSFGKLAVIATLAFGTIVSNADAAIAFVDLTNTTNGGTATAGNYNNFTQAGSFRFSTTASSISSNLIDDAGANTGWALSAVSTGNSAGAAGEKYTGGAVGNFPATATVDAFFSAGNANTIFTLSGLDTTLTYSFAFLSALNQNSAGTALVESAFGNTVFSINNNPGTTGTFTDIGSINPVTNGLSASPQLVTANGITAASDGTIRFAFRGLTPSGGTNTAGYLNTFSIASVPEPSSALLGVVSGAGLLGMLRRRR